MKQVLIEGAVKPVAAREADAYWALRDRTSQLGAWASRQSQPLDRRATLTARLSTYQRKFADGPVPRPPHWSGSTVMRSRRVITYSHLPERRPANDRTSASIIHRMFKEFSTASGCPRGAQAERCRRKNVLVG